MGTIKPSDVYTIERIEKVTSANDKDIEGDAVPSGKVLEIDFMSAIDITTASKTVRIGYCKENVNHWIQRIAVGSSGYGTQIQGVLYLVEGEKPICRVETPTNGDEVRFYVRGVFV